MSESANTTHDAPEGGGVYRPLEDRGYERGTTSDKDAAVPPSAQSVPSSQSASGSSRVGAKAIRWNWWALALATSVLIWAGLARLFGFI